VFWKSNISNKFGLNLETAISYTGGQRNSLDGAPCTSQNWHSEETKNLHVTSSRSNTVNITSVLCKLKWNIRAQTTLAFKVEQSKILEYYGQKNKDTNTAIVFICRIDELARANKWSDTVTYTNKANTLRGFAQE